jgi:hypothetical protein
MYYPLMIKVETLRYNEIKGNEENAPKFGQISLE